MNVYSQHIITNPDNNTQELYPFHYLEFYEANIHPYDEFTINERSERIYQGCMAQDFFQSHKDGFQNIIPLILFSMIYANVTTSFCNKLTQLVGLPFT